MNCQVIFDKLGINFAVFAHFGKKYVQNSFFMERENSASSDCAVSFPR